jgi:hypothetical protein
MDLLPWDDTSITIPNVTLQDFQPQLLVGVEVGMKPARGLLKMGTASRTFVTNVSQKHQHFWNGTDSNTFAYSVDIKLLVVYQIGDSGMKSLTMDVLADLVFCHADPEVTKSTWDIGIYQKDRVSIASKHGSLECWPPGSEESSIEWNSTMGLTKTHLDAFVDPILAAICKCWCDDLYNTDAPSIETLKRFEQAKNVGGLKIIDDKTMGGKWDSQKWGDASVDACFGRICTFVAKDAPCKLIHKWDRTSSGIDVSLSIKTGSDEIWTASLDLEPEFPSEGVVIEANEQAMSKFAMALGVNPDEARAKLTELMKVDGSMIVDSNGGELSLKFDN